MERKATLVLTSEAFNSEEEAALRAMKNGGLQSLHLGPQFEPQCPSGEMRAAWIADLNERIACYTQGFEVFEQKRGPAAAQQIAARFPMLEDEKL